MEKSVDAKAPFKGFGKSKQKKGIDEAIRKSLQNSSNADKEAESNKEMNFNIDQPIFIPEEKKIESNSNNEKEPEKKDEVKESISEIKDEEEKVKDDEKKLKDKESEDRDKESEGKYSSKSFSSEQEVKRESAPPPKKELSLDEYDDISDVEEKAPSKKSTPDQSTSKPTILDTIKAMGDGPRDSLSEEQKTTLGIVKHCLNEERLTVGNLIENEVETIRNVEGEELEAITIAELVSVLSSVCSKKLNFRQKSQLKGIFESIADPKKRYVLAFDLKNLLESVKESNCGQGLSNEAKEIVSDLADYLSECGMSLNELMSEIIRSEKVSKDGASTTVNVVNSSDFYDLLRNFGLVEEEDESLTEFLRVNESNPNKISLEKLEKLLKQAKDDF